VRDSVIEAASGRSFELHVTPLPARGGERPGEALFLFYDVTKLEALEGVRREFVANVSHELRTPLTSIKAFVETLLDARLEDRENSLKFLEIVRKHADRMSALIDDLTDLSLIETGSISLRPQDVEIGELAAEVTANLEPKLASAKVEARVEVPKGLRVRADRMRMEQVLVNLVDNAIKFNRPGGLVRISGAIEDGRTVVTVEDSGVGIPADSAEKVFHRFYRVDKGRSKELGGTGLGLSIVKHLMRLHGGQVRLESELGQGSKFILEFPPDAVL
jgi:two-component system phosphate regulon sensor histidine kinase PhoR